MIALIPLVDGERGRWWMNPDYMNSVTRVGGSTMNAMIRQLYERKSVRAFEDRNI